MRDAQWGLELRRGLFRSGRGAILREREVDGDVLRNTEAKRDRCPHLCACGIAPSPQAGFLQGVVEVRRIAQLAQQKGRKGGTQPLQPLAEVPRIGTGVFILPPAGRRLQLRESISHRSEEHTSELQSLMRISYAAFCLKQKKTTHITQC